ncbi:MAG TPA: hypothetical protein G4O06_01205 [Dehalococcoidia bacterium]|jgi:ribosomal protein S20|nr:hypothetical protein [Dehalococcoidia bacterium]
MTFGIVIAANNCDDNEPETLLERVRGEDHRAEYEAIVKRIQAAVEAGEITEEQAKERLDAYSKSLDQRVTKGVSVRKEE